MRRLKPSSLASAPRIADVNSPMPRVRCPYWCQVRTAWLFCGNEQGEDDARIPPMKLLKMLYNFSVQHSVHIQLLAYAFTFLGTVMLLPGVGALPDQASLPVTPGEVWSMSSYANESASSSGSGGSGGGSGSSGVEGAVRRALKAGGAGGGTSAGGIGSYSDWDIRSEGVWAWLWIVQAIALLLMMLHLARTFFMPFQDLYILLCTIAKMLTNDLATFMCAFLWFLVASYIALFTLYPRSGESALPQVVQFNEQSSAICVQRHGLGPLTSHPR